MAGDSDMQAHRQTYEGVMSLFRWGTLASAVVAFIVILLIS